MLRGADGPQPAREGRDAGRGPDFRLLGPFEVRNRGRIVDVGGAKQRVLLAALLLQAGRSVPVNELADMIWGDSQPGSPRSAVQLYVTRLRAILTRSEIDAVIATDADGYRMDLEPSVIDLVRFHRSVEHATSAGKHGDLAGAALAWADALAQWRGAPLAGVPSELLQRDVVPRLREERLQALERSFDVELRRGNHVEIVGELLTLTAQYPLRETLWTHLITALYRSGRRADALEAYHTLRRHLAEELGIDPSDDLQALHAVVLAGLAAPIAGRSMSLPPLPRQLPTDVPGFAGRADELVRLDGLLGADKRSPHPSLIVVIAGTAGIGKTTLAAHWARGVADRFPDGQLWLNLRGFDAGQAMTSTQALTRFLRALGVQDAEIPLDLDDQIGLYRSLMDGRRMLVVLDNAYSPEQVRAVLPGAPGCLVLVTSRNQLSGLVATEDAHTLTLDLLTDTEARQLLVRRLGTDRLRDAGSAVDEIIGLCARLPLALAIVAARAAAHPEHSLRALASELRAAPGSLDAFTGGDPATEVRAVFSWSYRALSAPAARLFRLLGLHPGPDYAVAAIASLAGLPVPRTRRLLVEMRDANLVTEHGSGRHTCHDLLRAYATELGLVHDSLAMRREARHRMLDHYLLTAHAGSLRLRPFEPVVLGQARPGVTIEDLVDQHQTLAWFAAEHHVILGLVQQAADTGFPAYASQIASTVSDYLYRQGYWRDWLSVLQTGLDAMTRTGSLAEQARTYRALTRAYARLGRMDAASAHGRLALELSEQLGDPYGLAFAHRVLGVVMEVRGDQREALSHDLQALELFKSVGSSESEARTLNSVGWSYAQIGDLHPALTYCERAFTQLTELDDRQGLAATCDSLGYIHHHLGEYQRAVTYFQRAIELFRDLDRYKEAECLTHLGDLYKTIGEVTSAGAAWRQALDIYLGFDHRDVRLLRIKLRGLHAEPTRI
jgi:DNA-binding SARP family transcriptional activator/tetratricopeptide (TPR) repeat protein